MKEILGIRLYDVKEVAEIIGMGVRSINTMLWDGRLTGRKINNKWFVSETELRRFLAPEHGQGDAPKVFGRGKE